MKYLPLVILSPPLIRALRDEPSISDFVITGIVITMLVSLWVALRD